MAVPSEWLTMQEVQEHLHVSRETVYRLAERYAWQTWQPGPKRRFWLRASVYATPDAHERRLEGWRKRRKQEQHHA